MDDTKELLQRARERFVPPEDVMGSLIRRRARKERNRKLSAGAIALVLALLSLAFLARTFRDADRPAERPRPGGIFSHVGGWIAYADRGGKGGIWAVNPAAPGDPKDRILLSPGTGWPVAWSSDGSRLLILRRNPERAPDHAYYGSNLFVLNADGTETRLTEGDAWITGGSFSLDGSKVVYATTIGDRTSRIHVVGSSGGTSRVLRTASRRWIPAFDRKRLTVLSYPTFSPDGSQIAFFDGYGDSNHSLMVMDADGSASRVVIRDLFKHGGHIYSLAWSPDGRNLLFDSDAGIYTLGANGTGLTLVFPRGTPGGWQATWSPDGDRIAYSRSRGLMIADADGKHVQEFGYARSGPWNPLDSKSTG